MATVTAAVSVFILRGFSLNFLLFSDVLMSLVVSSLRFSDPMAEYRKSASIYIPSGFCCLITGTIHETLGKMGEKFPKVNLEFLHVLLVSAQSLTSFWLSCLWKMNLTADSVHWTAILTITAVFAMTKIPGFTVSKPFDLCAWLQCHGQQMMKCFLIKQELDLSLNLCWIYYQPHNKAFTTSLTLTAWRKE